MRKQVKCNLTDQIGKLKNLKGDDLAMVYANEIISGYGGLDPDEARPAFIKVLTERLSDIKRAIEGFRKSEYPFAYNQQLRGEHDGAYREAVAEKEIVRGLMNLQRKCIPVINHYGKDKAIYPICDYEVPTLDKSGRVIDAVARCSDDRVCIYEAKNNMSTETLLRCLMEAFTYSLLINRDRFRESFGVGKKGRIVICPLIFEGTVPYSDLMGVKSNANEKQLFSRFVKELERVGDLKVEYAVLRTSDFFDKSGNIVFPDIGKTKFNKKWLPIK